MQLVKDLALSLQWLGSLLGRGFDPWSRNFHMLKCSQKFLKSVVDVLREREKKKKWNDNDMLEREKSAKPKTQNKGKE